MVKYWKSQDCVQAVFSENKEGYYEMHMKGEKYPFPGYPRGYLLFGKLSPLKHQIKNLVFNENWARLEEGKSVQTREAYDLLYKMIEDCKYDMIPVEKLYPSVKSLHIPHEKWRDILRFIFQEDDAYRMRLQWMAKFFRKPKWKDFDYALGMLEHAEIIEDMKGRVRLIRRVMNALYLDPDHKKSIDEFLQKTDWSKVRLSEGDKYHFRAKYFKVDYPEYQY